MAKRGSTKYIGYRIDSLTVIGVKGSKLILKCDCGKECVKSHSDLFCLRKHHRAKFFSCGCHRHLTSIDVCTRGVLDYYKRNAAKRDIPFQLSVEDFKKLIFSPCFYCGEKPGNSFHIRRKGYTPISYNGVDRQDNSKSYTRKNSVPCCSLCNELKWGLKLETFLNKVRQIAIHQEWLAKKLGEKIG